MTYEGLLFILLVTGLLSYLALRLGMSIYIDYSNAGWLRQQLLYRLNVLPLLPLLRHQGINIREFLHARPLYQVESLIRQCENCDYKQQCAGRLPSGEDGFTYCPARYRLTDERLIEPAMTTPGSRG